MNTLIMTKGHEYHKGSPCPYRPIRCAEGYCMRCQIYEETRESKLLSPRLPDGMDNGGADRVTAVENGGLNDKLDR